MIHPNPTGEGGFPCSRCSRLSFCCLPNDWKREDPVLEYVLTCNSPKVRKGRETRRTSKREDRGRTRGTQRKLGLFPTLLSSTLSLAHSHIIGRVSFVPLSLRLFFNCVARFQLPLSPLPSPSQPFAEMYTLAFEKLYVANKIHRTTAIKVLKMWDVLSCLASADVTLGLADHVRQRFDISAIDMEEPARLEQDPPPHVR